jgi:hypothetical protein
MWLLRVYQLAISALIGPACRFEPSCSNYAIGAISQFGLVKGSWLAGRRLLRCHPCGGNGYDPVPGRISDGS